MPSFQKVFLKTCSESAEFGFNSLQNQKPTEVNRFVWKPYFHRFCILSIHLDLTLIDMIFNFCKY